MKTLLSILAVLSFIPAAWADSGIVQFRTHDERYAITVLVHALPLRAGPATFSFLIEDRATKQPVLDAAVQLAIAPKSSGEAGTAWKAPCCSVHQGTDDVTTAERGKLGNLMLYDATVILPKSGEWLLTVTAMRGGLPLTRANETLQVGPPPSPWTEHIVALLAAPLGVAFLVIHQWRLGRLPRNEASMEPRRLPL